MTAAWERFVTWYRRLPSSTTPVLLIVAAVLVGNLFYLSGLSIDNPITWTSGITHAVECHLSCRRSAIDPNVGFITQPLGHLVAMDLLHGHLPWWNYFEGLGQPLVGEMQSAALFPLTLLFALPSGLLWFHVSLEIIAGVSTYFLARRLSIPVTFACAAGALFALNGTYAWLGNAVLNPVAFLPMLLLGVEMIYDGARGGSRKGWYVAALALALSLCAGFPEVAYFDGLFCAAWAVVRFFSLPSEVRLTAARRLGIAAVVGGLMSLPVLVPFGDFMKVANVGGHASVTQGLGHFSYHSVPMFFDPYVYGSLFSNPNASTYWGSIGGYFTISVTALALLGLFGKVHRPLRLFLGGWILVGLLGIVDILRFRQLWNVIPLVKSASFGRYVMPSLEMAMILLAVLGIMDFATSARAKRLFNATVLLALVVLVWSVLVARSLNHGVVLSTKGRVFLVLLEALPFVAIAALVVIGRFWRSRVAPLLLALVLVGESLAMFMVPMAEAPKSITIDQAPITYLLQHEGQDRFLDFAVISPNWGSQYGLNSLSAIDLPFPKTFTNLIETQLEPGLTPTNQFVIHSGMTGIVNQEDAVATHLKSYEDASVKYLVMHSSVIILPALTNLGVRSVFVDPYVTIYELPHPRGFLSTTSGKCTITSHNVNAATLDCPAATTLVRTELSMTGWHAYVNGRAVRITTRDGVYQSVTVPAGVSTVTFGFLPANEQYALPIGLLALLYLIVAWILDLRSTRRRARHRTRHRLSPARWATRRWPSSIEEPEGAPPKS